MPIILDTAPRQQDQPQGPELRIPNPQPLGPERRGDWLKTTQQALATLLLPGAGVAPRVTMHLELHTHLGLNPGSQVYQPR